jgi:hypothetical protein
MGLSKNQMNVIIGILIVCIALIWGAAITNSNTADGSKKIITLIWVLQLQLLNQQIPQILRLYKQQATQMSQ